MTTNPEVTRAAHRHTDLIADLADLGALLEAAGDSAAAGMPTVIQYPVPSGLDHEQKLAWLERVAAGWETVTFTDGMGGQQAEKRLRVLRLAASVAAPDGSVSGYFDRAAAFRASQAGAQA